MYIGLDLSLTSTGAVAAESQDDVKYSGLLTSPKKGVHRLADLKRKLEQVLDAHPPKFVAVEGYAMGKGGGKQNAGRVFDIGEWGGIVRLLLLERGIPTIIVPPSNLKMFVALNGNAKKDAMIQHVEQRFGFVTKKDDIADAYGLAIMAEAYNTGNTPTGHKKEQEALNKVKQIVWAKPARKRQRKRTT